MLVCGNGENNRLGILLGWERRVVMMDQAVSDYVVKKLRESGLPCSIGDVIGRSFVFVYQDQDENFGEVILTGQITGISFVKNIPVIVFLNVARLHNRVGRFEVEGFGFIDDKWMMLLDVNEYRDERIKREVLIAKCAQYVIEGNPDGQIKDRAKVSFESSLQRLGKGDNIKSLIPGTFSLI